MKAHDVFTRPEIVQLMTRSNLRASLLVLSCWAWVIAAMALVAVWPNFFTLAIALLLIAGRQLSFAILMHDCGHNSLFKSSMLNQFVGTWLVSAPVFTDMRTYSRQHTIHHKDVGSADDPDLANYAAYPITKASLLRKFLRDVCGLTALKFWFYIVKTRLGSQNSMVSNQALFRGIVVNLVIFLCCYALNMAWLYLVWFAAYNTIYFLFLRIRHIGEHAAVPNSNSPNMFENTRTTLSSWWERLLVSPVYVNYHIEHHLLPSVPPYNLPLMHRWLVAKKAYANTPLPSGYISMLRSVLH